MSKAGKSDSRGYLICSECGGYYKLKEGEDPSDFVSCQCGGSLQYYDSLEEAYTEEPYEVDETTKRISSEIIKSETNQDFHEIISTETTSDKETLENLPKEDYDDTQNFISTIQDKREEIKTHKDTKYLLILLLIVTIIILLIILISAGSPLPSLQIPPI